MYSSDVYIWVSIDGLGSDSAYVSYANVDGYTINISENSFCNSLSSVAMTLTYDVENGIWIATAQN